MKKFRLLLTSLFAFLAIVSQAQITTTIGDLTYRTINGTSAAVTKCSPIALWATIPSTVYIDGENYCVTTIEYEAFANCSVTAVIIPNSVTTIENDAFWNCSSLSSINIPDSLKTIECSTFGGCYNLKSISIPNSVTSIGEGAFAQCRLESITIPNSVTSIGAYAFQGNMASTIIIPSSVKTIGDYAFSQESLIDFCDVTNLATTPQPITDGTFTFYGQRNLHVLPGCKEAYEKADVWKNFNIVEDAVDPTSITKIKSSPMAQKIYSLDGVQRTAPEKGINIIGGKKMIIK